MDRLQSFDNKESFVETISQTKATTKLDYSLMYDTPRLHTNNPLTGTNFGDERSRSLRSSKT